MDCRFKTSFISLAIAACILVLTLVPALAVAQGPYYPDQGSYYPDNRSYGTDYEQPRVQRNQELPKGLTLVPWKIEQRTSLEEIREGTASGADAARRSRGAQNPQPDNR